MADEQMSPPWWRPERREEAMAWAEAELRRQGIGSVRLPTPLQAQPWSTVLRLPTSAGDCYLKAVAPSLLHEVAITAAIAGRHPHGAPPLIAVDPARGWMLMRDGGRRLRDLLVVEPDLGHWARLLAQYAELQIALSGDLAELLALGAPDRRPAALPGLYAALLDDAEALSVGRAEGLSADERGRLRALAPRLAEACAQLAGLAVPDSLHHGDLHDGNIFVGVGRYRIFDWGDCSLAHPFVGLRTPTVSVENTFGLAEGAPEFGPLRDAFLEPWTRFSPRPVLLQAFAVGARLAPLVSALGWRRSLASIPDAERAGYHHVVPSLLRELLGEFEAARR